MDNRPTWQIQNNMTLLFQSEHNKQTKKKKKTEWYRRYIICSSFIQPSDMSSLSAIHQFVWLTFFMFLILYFSLEYIHVKSTMLNFMINKKFWKRLGHIGYSNYKLADIKAQIHRENIFVKMTKDISIIIQRLRYR